MHILEHTDPRVFQSRVLPLLVEHECENCTIIGIIARLVEGKSPTRSGEPTVPVLLSIEDGNRVVGIAVQTPPHALLATPSSGEAVDALIAELHRRGWATGDFVATVPTAGMLADRWCAVTGNQMTCVRSLRVFRLDEVIEPPQVPGSLRVATMDDLEWLVECAVAFARDINEPMNFDPIPHTRRTIDEGRLHIWAHNGQRLAMCAWAGPTPNGIRINQVYTPPRIPWPRLCERRHRRAVSKAPGIRTEVLLPLHRRREPDLQQHLPEDRLSSRGGPGAFPHSAMSTKIGIIGFGRIGALHAKWIEQAEGCEVALVSDPTEARRVMAREKGIRVVESIDELLADSTIDAIVVATPTSMHFEQTIAALSAGKHVMVEKPMAMDLDQARRMIAEAQQRSRVLSVFQNRRWDVDFLTVKQSIESGIFGRVFNIESRLGQWESCVGPAAKEWNPNWRNEAQFGGGGLYDWGSHFLDQLWQLMLPAKPTRVFAQLRGNVWSQDCDDFARVLVDFDNGATGLVEINTTTARPLPRWHIDGTRGSAFSPYSPDYDTDVWASLRFTPADGSPSRTLPRAESPPTRSALWSQFAGACRGECEPPVPATSVIPTMALLDAARKSSAEGVAVALGAIDS